jgi:hypothetical protein
VWASTIFSRGYVEGYEINASAFETWNATLVFGRAACFNVIKRLNCELELYPKKAGKFSHLSKAKGWVFRVFDGPKAEYIGEVRDKQTDKACICTVAPWRLVVVERSDNQLS